MAEGAAQARRKPRVPSWLTLLIVVALAVAVVFVLKGARKYGPDRYAHDAQTFTSADLQMIATNIGVVLPSGTKGLRVVYDHYSCIDPAFVAKLQVPAEDKTLARQIQGIKAQEIHVSNALSERTSWWTPVLTGTSVDKQFHTADAYARVILCQENGASILYVEWSHD